MSSRAGSRSPVVQGLVAHASTLVSAAPAAPAEVLPHHLRTAAAGLTVRTALRRWIAERGMTPDDACLPPLPAAGSAAAAWSVVASLGMEFPTTAGLSLADLGHAHAAMLDHGARKHGGAWFTTAQLARATTERTLLPLLARGGDPLELRIVDPAVGAGAFLTAAIETLATHAGVPRASVARRCHGLDCDGTAAMLAAWSVWEAAGEPSLSFTEIAGNVRQGDGLIDLPAGCFDAVLGNPPWETLQPSRKEFFAGIDAGRDGCAQREWRLLREQIARRVLQLRGRFHHQGDGKLQTYRLFTEQAVRVLRPGGRLGLILPASLYFDRGARPLRELLLDQCRWEWLFAFENRRRVFPIDSRFRFAAVVAEKGGRTRTLRAAFGVTEIGAWAAPAPRHVGYPRNLVETLSPHSGALVELEAERDLELLQRMHRRGRPFLAIAGGDMAFAQGDFNLTSDVQRFRRWSELPAGYRAGDDGALRRSAGEQVFWPLLQGAMVWDFRNVVAGHAGGSGHGTRWMAVPPGVLRPQFVVPDEALLERRGRKGHAFVRILFRALSNATNERTAVCALSTALLPAGNSLGVLTVSDSSEHDLRRCAFGCGVMGSLAYDWTLRQRLAGTNLNQFVLADTLWPQVTTEQEARIALLVLRIGAVHPWDRGLWHLAVASGLAPAKALDGSLAARSPTAGRALRVDLELAVARCYGLGLPDLEWMLRDCAHPAARLGDPTFGRSLPPKGFWRVDRALSPDARFPTAVLAAARRGAGNDLAAEGPAG